MTLGQSFFTPERDTVKRHLWVVVSDSTKNPDVVIANISTRKANNSEECMVEPSEHPSVSRRSYIRCEQAFVAKASDLQKLLDARKLSVTKPAPAELVKKIQTVLGASQNTKIAVIKMLQSQGFIQPTTLP